jgi:hypothetical protein
MGAIITKLKNQFRHGDIAIQLIYINVAIFLVTAIISLVTKLMAYPDLSFSFLHFPHRSRHSVISRGPSSPICSYMRVYGTSCSTCFASIGSARYS